MIKMTHPLLLLLLFIASVQLSAQAGETSPDYESVYDDDETSRAPGLLAKSTAAPLKPYFNQTKVTVYIQPNESSVKLDCPVKNYDAQRHEILWYRDSSLLTNGNHSMISIFTLDSQLALTLPVANATGYNFSCRVMPGDVRRNFIIQQGVPKPSSAASLSWPAIVDCLILSSVAFIYRF